MVQYDTHTTEQGSDEYIETNGFSKFINSTNLYLVALVVGCVGVAANLTSLVINRLLKERGLPAKLTQLLNLFDALVCCMSIVVYKAVLYVNIKYFDFASFFLIRGSAMVTLLLSVSRTISISYPFYRISRRGLWASAVLLLLLQASTVVGAVLAEKEMLGEQYQSTVWFFRWNVAEMTLVLAVVTVSTGVSLVQLARSRNASDDDTLVKKATVTIVILSVLYIIFNGIFLAGFCENISGLRVNTEGAIERFSLYLGSPINSALNPIIILARKRNVGQFLRKIMTRVRSPCCMGKGERGRVFNCPTPLQPLRRQENNMQNCP